MGISSLQLQILFLALLLLEKLRIRMFFHGDKVLDHRNFVHNDNDLC